MQIPDGAVIRRVCGAVRVDEQHVCTPAIEACSGTGADQRVLAAGECGRLVSARCESHGDSAEHSGRYVWPSAWGPTYRNSYGICIATCGTAIGMCWIFRQHLARLNERLEQGGQRFRYML